MNLRREPVAIAAVIRSAILCAVAFGLDWSPDQIAAVMLVVEGFAAILVRDRVTPEPIILPGGDV